ncbi:antibiotic biosynthesis monooxygenase [Flavobacterium sp. Root186]|uniref:antibiotic biosynthesis monooxygenase n=1 Tax=Flavobacterium sp. Root186 TaxID=1736485 RepID=UPI0006F93EEE|nr:antibiotic biosynthesis monooxygenase [Flavobacterium sp. Root186]KRB58082.1 hypothetical protein ASD98_07435 [Flavobacterium sp. Root186]
MSFLSTIRLHASVSIKPENWDKFQQMVSKVKNIVASEEPGNVLTHETYYHENSFDCLIVEAYANENAFLEHLKKIQPLMNQYTINWNVNRMELCGLLSAETVSILKESVKEGEFIFYDKIF